MVGPVLESAQVSSDKVQAHARHHPARRAHSAQHACQQRTRAVHIAAFRAKTAILAEGMLRFSLLRELLYLTVASFIHAARGLPPPFGQPVRLEIWSTVRIMEPLLVREIPIAAPVQGNVNIWRTEVSCNSSGLSGVRTPQARSCQACSDAASVAMGMPCEIGPAGARTN